MSIFVVLFIAFRIQHSLCRFLTLSRPFASSIINNMPFSYTAPTHSKEDDEREFADLSPEQKEDILDDAYGRNAEEIAAMNEREITQQELDTFDEALENLPAEDNAEAAIAAKTVLCPELVELETNPSMFLRRENYNPRKAAKRFAAYWNFRVDLLGDEKAFLPISLAEGGAFYNDEEIVRMMRESPTYRYVLPNDKHGRSVLFCEADQQRAATIPFSRQAKIKYSFYIHHRIMKQKSSISKGVTWLFILEDRGQFNMGLFDRIKMKRGLKFVIDCAPFTLRALHAIFPRKSSSVVLILPIVKHLFNSFFRMRLVHHYLSEQYTQNPSFVSIMEVLQPYGFEKEGLPECLGGTYQFNTSWAEEQMNYGIGNEDHQRTIE